MKDQANSKPNRKNNGSTTFPRCQISTSKKAKNVTILKKIKTISERNDSKKIKTTWSQLGYQTLTFSHNYWKASWLFVLPRRNSSDQPWPKVSSHQCLASYYFDVVHRYFILIPDPSKLLLMPFELETYLSYVSLLISLSSLSRSCSDSLLFSRGVSSSPESDSFVAFGLRGSLWLHKTENIRHWCLCLASQYARIWNFLFICRQNNVFFRWFCLRSTQQHKHSHIDTLSRVVWAWLHHASCSILLLLGS